MKINLLIRVYHPEGCEMAIENKYYGVICSILELGSAYFVRIFTPLNLL